MKIPVGACQPMRASHAIQMPAINGASMRKKGMLFQKGIS